MNRGQENEFYHSKYFLATQFGPGQGYLRSQISNIQVQKIPNIQENFQISKFDFENSSFNKRFLYQNNFLFFWKIKKFQSSTQIQKKNLRNPKYPISKWPKFQISNIHNISVRGRLFSCLILTKVVCFYRLLGTYLKFSNLCTGCLQCISHNGGTSISRELGFQKKSE